MITLLTTLVACGTIEPYEEQVPDPGPETSLVFTEQPEIEGFYVGSFCDVKAVFGVSCVTGCHSGFTPQGGLDLETDPYAALVGVSSVNFGPPLVTPGNAEASLLYQKMVNTQGVAGTYMPPTGVLDPLFANVVGAWIQEGAPNNCVPYDPNDPGTETTPAPTNNGKHHPDGWADAGFHGLAAKLQTDGDCRACHGTNLDGGSAGVGCDSCHDAGWRTNCTFCHGGIANQTGAPPEDIDDNTNPATLTFSRHTTHVSQLGHPAYGCESCHKKPTDFLSPGHVFDDVTPGYGEVDYTGGISKYGTYLGGGCTNMYCHGDGRGDNGTVYDGDGPFSCYDCHPDISDAAGWNQMSGDHAKHLNEGVVCSECHGLTVDTNQNVVGPNYHVNGAKDVQMEDVLFTAGSCDGTCHGETHNGRTW